VAYGAPQEGSQKRTGNANEHRNEDSARLFAWNDEFGECAYDEANQSGPEQMKHSCFLRVPFTDFATHI
jgi:hypothetical protein